MRGNSDVEAEACVLTSEVGRALLAEVSAVLDPGPAELTRWRKEAPADLVSATLRLAACRRRGAAKFSRAGAMWFEATGLEQATAEPVARHKARRFEGGLVVDLCAGIGGDTLALASGATVLAVDLDAGMNRRARWNAEVYGVAERVAPVRARAEAFPIPRGAWLHIDPDRRAGLGKSGRARVLHDYVPGPEFLARLPEMAPGGAIKLGPASDFAVHFAGAGFEVELVSLGGECKEATIWFGDLATCRRRATRLPDLATWTDRSAPDAPPIAPGASRWSSIPTRRSSGRACSTRSRPSTG
ncbi:MAG: class I SAM-dependent methyltransferase [Singulisphaera sp.]